MDWLNWRKAEVEDNEGKLTAITFERKMYTFKNLNKSFISKFLGHELVLKFSSTPLTTILIISLHREDSTTLSKFQCELILLDYNDKVRFTVREFITIGPGEKEEQIKSLTLDDESEWNKAVYLPEGIFRIRCTLTEAGDKGVLCDEATQTDAMDIEEPNSTMFLKVLSNDLAKFYDDQSDSDCVLKVGETKFPVHRAVLSSRSTVFAAMFHHDTSENRSGDVDILDIEASILDSVLYYIYSAEIRGLTADTAIPMYVAADKYALLELRNTCLKFILANLTVENICDAANLAHMHGELALTEKVIGFIEEKLEEIVESDRWKIFLKEKPYLANKLLCTALLYNKKR